MTSSHIGKYPIWMGFYAVIGCGLERKVECRASECSGLIGGRWGFLINCSLRGTIAIGRVVVMV
ncbi:hypothetical protein BDZ91DRAFT_712754 [Kalaharituber pfeilii]|nr:hypothetical protein BDZ91DRAFT_712754 [Kalaharituber pfeilii]